jgi:4-phytase/acid phosphatase
MEVSMNVLQFGIARVCAVVAVAVVVLIGGMPPRPAAAQGVTPSDLRMVVVVMRHGVRAPTHPSELNAYSAQPWPKWNVPGGYLTPRGALLMRQFGRHYRAMYGSAIFPPSGCPTAGSIYVWADIDERTRATGESLVQGLVPGCNVEVHHASGDPDRLFDPLPGFGKVDVAKSKASVLGSLGGDPNSLLDAYHAEFGSLERILGCGPVRQCARISQVPTTVTSTGDGGLAEFNGGLDLAADVAENLLLEYTDGQKVVGWGRADRTQILDLLQLHALKSKFQHENRYAAQAHSSNVMLHVLQTLAQGATSQKVAGTRVPLTTRFFALVGHDTQLSEIAGLLQLSWLMRGYQLNDTPPGAAIVFELHGPADSAKGTPFVRTFFTAQTMNQMRDGNGASPGRVPVYVPGCPGYDCPIGTFEQVVNSAIDPSFTGPW